MTIDVGNRLIAAIDAPDRTGAAALVSRLGGVPSWYKIGLELFCAEGPALVKAFVERGRSIMLDLKLHDIPETVARATERLANLGAGMLTVHAGGGRAMLEAAVSEKRGLQILAVTVLTSLDEADLAEIGALGSVEELVRKRSELAIAAGCDGVVASPYEVAAIRAIAPPGFLVITPGVRPAGSAPDDQKRVMTPKEARAAGADMIVLGRPLREAADPAAAARAVVAELAD
ncbi:MAG: orotidine-5'-phosphate decarboxylase [Kofleriaceae bacterium]